MKKITISLMMSGLLLGSLSVLLVNDHQITNTKSQADTLLEQTSIINTSEIINQASPFAPVEISSVTEVANPPADIALYDFSATLDIHWENSKVMNVDILMRYLNLNSFPPDTTYFLLDLEFGEYNAENTRNQVSYELLTDKHYPTTNSDDVVTTPNKSWGRFTFTGLPQHRPTEIAKKAVIAPNDFSPKTFLQKLVKDGAIYDGGFYDLNDANMIFLEQFIDIVSPSPTTYYKILLNDENNVTGIIDFEIFAFNHYDGAGSFADWHLGFLIELQLKPFVGSNESKIEIILNHPKNLMPNQFEKYITTSGKIVDKTKLAEYFTLENIPSASVITIENPMISNYINNVTRVITFDLKFSEFATAPDVVGEHTETDIVLSLANQYEPTNFKFENDKIPTDLKPGEFIEKLKTDGAELVVGHSDVYKLNNTNLEWVQNNLGHFSSKIENSTWWFNVIQANDVTGIMEFELSADYYYNIDSIATGSLGSLYNPLDAFWSHTATLARGAAVPVSAINSLFQWWWILVAIGGAAVIGILTWLMIKRQKERQIAVKRIQRQKEITKTE